ncbi:MAG: hypothetical protein KatS3mg014_1498 [Actinomycetota bacterium]|nr:MAG: hypothetical protein KatS3mg014_1498 [Actinomycetota bacterium]
MRIRYSRWDGTQDPLGPDLPVGELLEAISDDVLAGVDPREALDRLRRRGLEGRFSGLDALLARLREARQRELERLNLAGPLEEVRERLEGILERERSTLAFRADDDAREREAFLEALPPDVPGRIRELRGYRFADPEAQRGFDELLEHLREQVMGAFFRRIAEGMRSLGPEDLARLRDMLAELNDMIERRDRGEPVDFEGFMGRYGDLFPDRPRRSRSSWSVWPAGWRRSRACSPRSRPNSRPSSASSPSRSFGISTSPSRWIGWRPICRRCTRSSVGPRRLSPGRARRRRPSRRRWT